MPAGSAAAAASKYFATLSVENCGASGMPMMRVTPARRELGERRRLMNGVQLRMPTATGTSGPSRARKRVALSQRQVGQRRAPADRLVVVPHLLDELGDGGRPPRTRRRYSGISSSDDGVPCAIRRTPVIVPCLLVHVARERLHVLDAASTGRMPWPRLKMWPGRPPARASTSSAPASTPVERAEQQRRIEVALDGAIDADALPGLVERRAPVGADHVAARLAQLARESLRCPTPK